MDTTPKYILMCEKAAKDLGGAYDKPPDHSDFIAMEQTVGKRNFEVMCGLAMWRRMAPYDPITSDRLIIKLYRQDQLQDILNHPRQWAESPFDMLCSIYDCSQDWCGGGAETMGLDKFGEYLKKFTSAEQIWLAFVMKQKYQKIWNGKEWIIEQGP